LKLKGRYEYKYLVDGRWMIDDAFPKTDNQMGTQNNVISIDEADFAVFIYYKCYSNSKYGNSLI
jgi:hypothetical protein